MDESGAKRDLKPLKTSALSQLSPEVQKIIMDGAKKLVELDDEIDAFKQGTTAGLIHQYKQLIVKRYQTHDTSLHPHYEKELNEFSMSVHQNKTRFDKLQTIEPKIGKLIQSRAQHILSKNKDQEIEC